MSSAYGPVMRIATAVFCLLAVTACFREGATEPGPVDVQVTLAPGQSASIRNVSLRFIGVTGDNRCPADVVCVLGGSAAVTARVTIRGGSRDLTFETGNPQPVVEDALTFELVQLQPYPFSTRTIEPEEYRATFRVKR
jgi:hypothetical protein